MEKTRKRSSYNNLDSYDDELDIVFELLEGAEDVEEELVKEFEGLLRELCRLYNEKFPFYYPQGVLNKDELRKLTLSLNYGIIRSEIDDLLTNFSQKVEQLQTNRLMAWLILDYELTSQKTAESIGVEYKDLLPPSSKREIVTQS